MKEIIIFDIDDTITNFERTYLEYAIAYDKTLRGSGQIHPEAKVSRSFDWSEEERREFRTKYRVLTQRNTTIKYGAVKLLNKLSKKYDIWILSARNAEDFDMDILETKKWLTSKNIPYSKVIFAKDKAEFIRNTNNVMAYIDDNVKHCEEAINMGGGAQVYLYTTKENGSINTRVPRVKSYIELEKVLCQKGMI